MMQNLSIPPSFSLVWILMLFYASSTSATSITRPANGDVRGYYMRSHSLGDGYRFDPREWESINVTDLDYKYSKPPKDKRSNANLKNAAPGGTISHIFGGVWNGLKGIGKNEEAVEITWYTGHDLKNPSCWENPSWSPTDGSMACALTARGWTSQPKCFKFLELCNGPKKCVFVRVVDSCAGCAAGSKHVDLTKSAFSQLANLDKGMLNVKMRPSSDPEEWYEDLWGPKK